MFSPRQLRVSGVRRVLDRFSWAALCGGLLLSLNCEASLSPDGRRLVVTGSECGRLLVEAPESGVLRLWFKAEGDFIRDRSLALETASPERLPLTGVVETPERVIASSGELSLEVNARTLEFTVRDRTGTPLVHQARVQPGKDGAWTLTQSLAGGERLFGLGQDNENVGRLDRRGTVRDLWAGQQINSGKVTAQYPVPFLLSSGSEGRGYGMFFDNVHRLVFDLGRTDKDRLRLQAPGGEMDLYVVSGPGMADLVTRYTALTGRPALPPLWALGYWQSKCTYYDWKPLNEAYTQLRSRGFPVDVMVIDYDWPEIINNYQWAKRWYPEGGTPADKVRDYLSKGVRVVMSQSGPAVRQESPTFTTGWNAGVFATDGKGNPVECCHYGGKLLDFTHPKLNDWLWPQVSRINRDGVAGWWLDLTEPEGEPPQTHYHGGARPASVHNQYALLCTRSYEGVQLSVDPDRRPFILNRCAPAGAQRYHQAVWTGDVYSDYATLRSHPPEMLNSGLSGLVYWTSDSGGFMNGYYKNDQMGAHARLYERWMQFSVFSPVTRAHKAGGLPEPYAFGPTVEQSCLHYLKLRYRLLPYIYAHAWEASRTGMPLVRPMLLEFPGDAQALASPGDQYLFGSSLLVAPVLFEGQVNRTVHFPAGTWYDLDQGYEYEGGRAWVVAAPQNRIPVAVRAGAIIPQAPDMANTGEKPWDPLTIEAWPSGDSEFTLYRDDGVSFAYQKGDYTTTRIRSLEAGASVVLSVEASNTRFTPKRYEARLHLLRNPLSVTLDGCLLDAASWSWDPRTRVLTLGFAAGEALRHELRVLLEDTPLPRRPAPLLEAQVIDPSGEAAGSVGKPVPHFFPAPALPARVKAINYDKGGEGVAFHSTRPLKEEKLYNRPDDFSIVRSSEAGGYVLGGLQGSEWVRYSVDCGKGGRYDLSLRLSSVKGGGRVRLMVEDRELASVPVPATGGTDWFVDVKVPGVYLPPGDQSLVLYVDSPNLGVAGFDILDSAVGSVVLPASYATRSGIVEVAGRGEVSTPEGYVKNFGKLDSSLSYSLWSTRLGEARLRLRYAGGAPKGVTLSCAAGSSPDQVFTLPPTGGAWTDFELPIQVQPGHNRIVLKGQEKEWDAVNLLELELIP